MITRHDRACWRPGPALCFVCPEAYGALTGLDDCHANGAELQQAILARELAARGYPVGFVTAGNAKADGGSFGGVRLLDAYDPADGVRYVRLIHPRTTGLWRAMKRADADIYFQRTSDMMTGVVAAFCRRYGRKFVFSVASDVNCLCELPNLPARERPFYRFGLRNAHRVIAQTRHQQSLLQKNFQIRSTVIGNCGLDEGGAVCRGCRCDIDLPQRLIWVGHWIPVKRLEMLLDVAERRSNLAFDVIGDACETEGNGYSARLRRRAELLDNVRIWGRVAHGEMGRHYERAAALICTSRFEGFPNTFVEAWRHGLPVVSTFDPDNVIVDCKLGRVAHDADSLVGAIDAVMANPVRWKAVSQNARKHYQTNHSLEVVIPKFERVFEELMAPDASCIYQ